MSKTQISSKCVFHESTYNLNLITQDEGNIKARMMMVKRSLSIRNINKKIIQIILWLYLLIVANKELKEF